MDKGQRWSRTPTNWLIKNHVFDTYSVESQKWLDPAVFKSGHFQCGLHRLSGIFNIPVCGGFCAPTRSPEEWLDIVHPWDDHHQILRGLLEPPVYPVSVIFGDYHMISLWCIIMTVILQVCNIRKWQYQYLFHYVSLSLCPRCISMHQLRRWRYQEQKDGDRPP